MLAKRLKQLRQKVKLSQVKIAEKLSVSQGCYASWETGRNEPDISTLCAICRIGGVSMDWLLELDGSVGASSVAEPEYVYHKDPLQSETDRLLDVVMSQQRVIESQSETIAKLVK